MILEKIIQTPTYNQYFRDPVILNGDVLRLYHDIKEELESNAVKLPGSEEEDNYFKLRDKNCYIFLKLGFYTVEMAFAGNKEDVESIDDIVKNNIEKQIFAQYLIFSEEGKKSMKETYKIGKAETNAADLSAWKELLGKAMELKVSSEA